MTLRTVVFIPGEFLSHHCWDDWTHYFEGKGYQCITAPWPFKDATTLELKGRHPDVNVGSLTLTHVFNHYARIIRSLGEKPIVIGHSMGGLIVQLLMQEDFICLGIVINSLPSYGMSLFHPSFLRTTWRLFNPFQRWKSHKMDLEKWMERLQE